MVKELLARTVDALRAEGYEPTWINFTQRNADEPLPQKTFNVHETYRINHNKEANVTVTIEITSWSGIFGKRLGKVNVPKDASEKVLKNRVEKAIEIYLAGE